MFLTLILPVFILLYVPTFNIFRTGSHNKPVSNAKLFSTPPYIMAVCCTIFKPVPPCFPFKTPIILLSTILLILKPCP